MKTKFNGILTLLLAFTVHFAFAQKTVSGTVSDDTGPLPGVSVLIKGTSMGTETDFDGKYSIQANTGAVLQYSFIGMETTFKTVGTSNTLNVLMSGGVLLEEVVVTAQGIKKDKKALGYAVSSVKEDQIKDKAEADLTRVLSGKSAGVNITTQNGLSGSSNKIVIRGMNSFDSDNNALYVIDGVPISNDTNEAGDFIDGNMGSSRSFDIDPNNIEKIDILKGLAAATLYGSAGRNGVVLITTKTGSQKDVTTKQEIQFSTSYFFNEVASLPDYQDQFGGGFDQAFGWFYSNWGPGFHENGLGGWGNDPLIDENGTIPHPISTITYIVDNFPGMAAEYADQRYEWKPRNSVEDFFRTGGTSNTSVNMKGRSDDSKLTYGLSFSHLDDQGFTPGNSVTRSNFSIGGSAKLSNKITFSGSLNYARTNYKTPPVALSFGSGSAGTSIFGDLFYTPRNIDIFELPYQAPDGNSIYYREDNAIQHPLWTVENAKFSQLTNRMFGNASITYNLTENLNLLYRASLDTYSEDNVNKQNRGGVSDSSTLNSGIYNTWNNNNVIWDHTILFNGSGYTFADKFNLGFDLGATVNSTDFNQMGIKSYDQQVFGFFDHGGFLERNQMEYHEKRNILGVFGQASFDYDNMIFINVSGRNDWVSNAINNSLFYPSVSASFIPTQAFKGLKSTNGINFLKLRAGYGTSANFSKGYPTASLAILDTQQWVNDAGEYIVGNTTDSFRANKDIRPELFQEFEYGIEGRLFSRVNFDFSYYTRITKDLIISQPLPAASGYTRTTTNIGEIVGDGIEADLGIDVFKNEDGFNWNTNVNFNKASSEVTELGQDADQIIYAGYTNLGNGAQVGYPLGAIFGSRIARNDNGDPLVDAIGIYVSEDTTNENDDIAGLVPFIGDPNPDFVMNYTNTFSYKNFSLNFTFNHTSGGDIYSQTISTLLGRGLTTDTLEGRLGTFVLPGVSEATGLPNDIQINNSDFYFSGIFAHPAEELSVYDASVVRLQEISIGYTFSKKFLEQTPFGRISIKASGYNMWYNAYNTPEGVNFDPNVSGLGSGNGAGFDYLTGPSGKKYGLSVNLTF